ncbi:hypothetical protein GcM1_191006, partial [Golovinomyces cichoracearum]
MAMENAAMYKALKAESLSVKKELENFREENVPCGIDKFKDMVSGAPQKTTDSSRKNCSQKSEIWSASSSTQLPEHQSIANDLPKKPENINRPGFKAD